MVGDLGQGLVRVGEKMAGRGQALCFEILAGQAPGHYGWPGLLRCPGRRRRQEAFGGFSEESSLPARYARPGNTGAPVVAQATRCSRARESVGGGHRLTAAATMGNF